MNAPLVDRVVSLCMAPDRGLDAEYQRAGEVAAQASVRYLTCHVHDRGDHYARRRGRPLR